MLVRALMLVVIHIQAIAVPRPYSAVQIEVGGYPVGGDISSKVNPFLTTLIGAASTGPMTDDVFLQTEYLKNGRDRFDPHIAEWMPESGLGVWPDRAAPELWKLTDIFRMATGERVPLINRVDRLTADSQSNQAAFHALLGSGMVMAIVHSDSTDDLLKRYEDTFLPRINEPNLRIFPFYVPLLDLNSLHNRKAEELRDWLGGARLYLRESPSDRAVLVITSSDINSLLIRAGARSEGDGHWSLE